MIVVIIIIIYVLVVAFDYVPIIKQKNKGEIILYTSLLILSFILILLIAIEVKLPNPTNLIKYLLKPIIKV